MKILLFKYFDISDNLEDFEKIRLTSSTTTIWGSNTFGGVEAGRWMKILEIANNYLDKIRIRPIIKYIKEQISYARKVEKVELEREYAGRR